MAIYNNYGDTIEGEAVLCKCRKKIWQGLKKHPLTKKTMCVYVTDRNSRAKVTKEGIIPKGELFELTKHYHRNVDDEISGDALSVYIDSLKPVSFEVVHGKEASHRHGLMMADIHRHTIASVKVVLSNLQKKLGYSSNYLTNKH